MRLNPSSWLCRVSIVNLYDGWLVFTLGRRRRGYDKDDYEQTMRHFSKIDADELEINGQNFFNKLEGETSFQT